MSEVDKAARFRKGLITQSVMFGSEGKCEPNHPECGPVEKIQSTSALISGLLITSDVFNFHRLVAKQEALMFVYLYSVLLN